MKKLVVPGLDIKTRSKDFLALNQHLLGADAARTRPASEFSEAGRDNTAEKGSDDSTPKFKSQLEAQFDAYLRREFPEAKVYHERYTLLLAKGLRYKPDFAVVHKDRTMDFYECKGKFIHGSKSHARATKSKPKCAAELFPHHRFFIVEKGEFGLSIIECYPL